MPKPRDYKAEYQRRIAKGMARGMTRSQAAGHPKEGELPASLFPKINPFDQMKGIINDMNKELDRIVNEIIPQGKAQTQQNELEYDFDQYIYGANPLPSWSIGDESSPPNMADIDYMFRIVKVHRHQQSYLMVVCGTTEEVYPGHEDEVGCLSYRVPRQELDKYLDKPGISDPADFINRVIGSARSEVWVSVTKVKIVDKD